MNAELMQVSAAKLTPAKQTAYFYAEDFFWLQYCTKCLYTVLLEGVPFALTYYIALYMDIIYGNNIQH